MKLTKGDKGWKQESMRHSNAKKFGKAGGPYAKDGIESMLAKQITAAETKLKKKDIPYRERELILREERLRLRKKLVKEERETQLVRAKAKKLKEEVMHERLLLPQKHMGKKRILAEQFVVAKERGDAEKLKRIHSKIVKLEEKEPKLFIKGTKRLAKLQTEQAEIAEARRKIVKRKLKAMKALPRKKRIAKIKRVIRIPDAVARAEAITAGLPTHREMEEKVEPRYRPVI